MARISSYPIDSTIQDKDSWVGTDSSNRVTRNFTAEDIASYVVTSTSFVTGSGTFNTIPLWTPDGKTLGDSIVTQDSLGGNEVNVAGRLSVDGDFTAQGRTLFNGLYARFLGEVQDNSSLPGTSGQVLSSTGTNVQWVDPSSSITKLVPHFQTATPGGTDTYTQSNNIVDFDWSGGSGTYEYILPSATDIPYRTIRFVNNSTVSANTKVRITAPGTETIDGGAFYEINKAYNGCAVWSDGVQWIVIQAKA